MLPLASLVGTLSVDNLLVDHVPPVGLRSMDMVHQSGLIVKFGSRPDVHVRKCNREALVDRLALVSG